MRARSAAGLAVLLTVVATAPQVRAGAFIFASEANGVDVVTHPTGYTGSGGTLAVTVCIDPTSANAAQMVVPVQNAVSTWNALAPTSPNLISGAANTIPSGQTDFESVALHEMGHCIGLAHVNLASESGLTDPDRNYTKSTNGVDDVFNVNTGSDGVRGSSDDVRGDDVNLHWFRRLDNNPFLVGGTIDATTYARSSAALPLGHTFAANADRSVAVLHGAANTESVMQQGTYSDEDQRALAADDVVHGERGTARRVGAGTAYHFAGKTGTAQLFSIAQDEVAKNEETPKHLRDHALFIAFAPTENPQIAIAVVVENGGSGSGTAAPIARVMLDYYLTGTIQVDADNG
jgi:hypothetical protein